MFGLFENRSISTQQENMLKVVLQAYEVYLYIRKEEREEVSQRDGPYLKQICITDLITNLLGSEVSQSSKLEHG